MPIDYIARAEENMRNGGPFHKEATKIVMARQTQAAIIEVIKQAAELLAESAVASEKVTGDQPYAALDKWMSILRQETRQIIDQKKSKPAPALPAPNTIEGKAE